MKSSTDYNLSRLNTFHIPVIAKEIVWLDDTNEFIRYYSQISNESKVLILGGGSNVLFVDTYFEGVVIKPEFKHIQIVHEDHSTIELEVGAGEDWDSFVHYTVQRNYGGIENLSLIPGNVGTCPIQNIGAYGVEVKDVITFVKGFYLQDLTPFNLNNAECRFEYRQSIFKSELKNKVLITSVGFRLSKRNHNYMLNYGEINAWSLQNSDKVNLQSIRDKVIDIRLSKLPDPDILGNAGSFFKNPVISTQVFKNLEKQYPEIPSYQVADGVKIPAAYLIEQCGLKGFREGDSAVHEKQPLVLVNFGNATGQDIFLLAQKVKKSVFDKFGIELDFEVNLIH